MFSGFPKNQDCCRQFLRCEKYDATGARFLWKFTSNSVSSSVRVPKGKNFNNEIGLPLCALMLDSKNEVAVFEMGAAKKGDIHFLSKIIQPDIGIITHIGHSHLDGLNSVQGVLKVKSELINNIKQNGSAIVPDGKYLNYWKKMRDDITFYTFGKKPSASYFPSQIRMTKQGLSFFIESI